MNNAGLMTGGLLEEQDLDGIYAMFQVNLVGVVHLTQAVLPGMIERGLGKVVNNASISGYAYFPAATTYAASKAGVVAFTESLRRELKGTGVTTLHLVTPGVDTEHARRHRGRLRPLPRHLRLGEAAAGGVGGQGGGRDPRRQHRARARAARPRSPS